MLARYTSNGFICYSCRHRLAIRHHRPQQTRSLTSSTPHAPHQFPSSRSLRSRKKPDYIPTSPVRTRFAPSPTGHLHLGSLRTALYNYLIARRTGGQFILRIEDTDTRRTVPGAEARILSDLQWAGIKWDEGPDIGGPYGPYRQSERVLLYRAAADELIARGVAYRCFCSAEKLKEKAKGRRRGFAGSEGYDRTCFHMSKEGSERLAKEGRPFVIRLVEPEKMVMPIDLTYGNVRIPESQKSRELWQDPILMKTNGMPTYHLANVVDDHYMKISHVIRGSEWLVSTTWHLELYRAFGWEPPVFAHVGLLMDEEGHKLSKREKSLDLGMMKEEGVLPEALCNFIALLGWNHGRDSDVLSMQKMEEIFTLKFNSHSPVVSLRKLRYLSPRHVEARVVEGGEKFEELVQLVMDAAKAQYSAEERDAVGLKDDEKLRDACRWILQSNSKNFTSVTAFVESQPYFFSDRPNVIVDLNAQPPYFRRITEELGIDEDFIRSKFLEYIFPPDGKDLFAGPVQEFKAAVDALMEFFAGMVETTETAAARVEEGKLQKIVRALVYPYLRGWISWGAHGPPLVETMMLLGPEVVRRRIENVQIQWKYRPEENQAKSSTSEDRTEEDPSSLSESQGVGAVA